MGLVNVHECELYSDTALLLNRSTSLGPGSWAFGHILSLPTRPPAAHQEKEIRTIPSCHCPTTRAREEEFRLTKHTYLFMLAIQKRRKE